MSPRTRKARPPTAKEKRAARRAAREAEPAPAYCATIIRAQAGHRLAKRYRGDPLAPPDDYDAGVLFDAREIGFADFDTFVGALAALLRVSTRAARRLAHTGRLVSVRDGGGRSPARLLFPRAELARYLESIASR